MCREIKAINFADIFITTILVFPFVSVVAQGEIKWKEEVDFEVDQILDYVYEEVSV